MKNFENEIAIVMQNKILKIKMKLLCKIKLIKTYQRPFAGQRIFS